MGEIDGEPVAVIKPDTYFAPSIGNILSWRRGEVMTHWKEHVRTLLEGGVQLSVPLVGGNSILKHRAVNWDRVCISSHGDWQRKHLGAWQAIYGKTPYFIHIFPELERIYKEHSQATFRRFCVEINTLIEKYLSLDRLVPFANEMRLEHPLRFREIQSEIDAQISPDLTVFDALFRLGPDVAYIFL